MSLEELNPDHDEDIVIANSIYEMCPVVETIRRCRVVVVMVVKIRISTLLM